MKKLIILSILLSTVSFSAEIFKEFHIMEKTMLDISKSRVYDNNGNKYKLVKVDRSIMKKIGADGELFYMTDSKNDKVTVRLGDFLVAPLSLSEIYVVSKEDFDEVFE